MVIERVIIDIAINALTLIIILTPLLLMLAMQRTEVYR